MNDLAILNGLLISFPPSSSTAEIFGVVEVVVSSRRLVESKEFQNLSVTSEKWLKITEVQPRDLKSFLENLRMRRGYSVGEWLSDHEFLSRDKIYNFVMDYNSAWRVLSVVRHT